MTNNDILRRLRYAFDFDDKQALALFTLDPNSRVDMDKGRYHKLLARDDDADFLPCDDQTLSAFLDGLIGLRRGLREPGGKPPPKPERLSKNDVLRKLRIAMNFRDQDMLDILARGGTRLSKSELSAFFRKPDHKHFRTCGNQVLRNFIKGLTLTLRNDTGD